MIMVRNAIRTTAVVLAVAVLLGGCGIRRKKYTNPITKDTQQPDKVLFDKAINDIEHSRYEIARLTLQTLINTYDSSEFLAKAKLAIADRCQVISPRTVFAGRSATFLFSVISISKY